MRSRFRYGRWLIVLFLAVACLSPTAALASNKGIEVPCRVEPNLISLSIDDGIVAYGVVAVGTTQDTTALIPTDTQTVTNTSDTEMVDFEIKSSDATNGTQWTLGATAAPNVFTHKASLDGGSTWPVVMTPADTYVPLVTTGVAVDATVDFDLQIGMPTSITDYGVQHTITVTIKAVQH